MAEIEGTSNTSTPGDGEKPSESGKVAPSVASGASAAPVVTVLKSNDVHSQSARPPDPNSTEATRAALRKTLQAGVGLGPSPAPSDRAAGELFEQARRVAALADTQQDLTRPPGGSSTQPPRPSRNPKLGRTLRLDLKVPPATDEPQVIEARETPEVAPDQRHHSPRPHIPTQHGVPLPPIQPPHQQAGEFSTTRPAYTAVPPTRSDGGEPQAPPRFSYDPGMTGSRTGSLPPSLPRKRPLRPGERTMVLSRRRNARKDWLFVVLVVGALGVTASMLLSYRSNGSDPETAEAVPEEEEQAPEDTALQAASADPAQPTSSSTVRATELRSEPAGAEVVVNGAVVGNTPVRVARADADVDYTLRLPGYESKVVRVGAQSPASIAVTLRQNAAP